MPADTSILMGFRPPQIESQDALNARAAQQMVAQQQNMLGAMQLGEMARANKQKNALREKLSKLPSDMPEEQFNALIERELIAAGDLDQLMARRKSIAEIQAQQFKGLKEKAQAQEAEAGTAEKQVNVEKKRYDHSLTQLSNAHNVDEYIARVKESKDKKYMTPEQADQALREASEAQAKDIAEGGNKNYQMLRRSYIERLLEAKDKLALDRPNTDIGKLMFERDKLAPNDPNRKAYDDAIKKATTHSPGTNVNVALSTEKKYGEKFAGNIADSDVKLKDAAEQAPQLADTSNRISQLLKSGQVFTGTGANIKLQLAKALKVAGGTENEAIANTETLISSLASQTLANIKSSGLGSGQGFTDKDRDFLQAATAGNITLDNKTLQRLADLSHKSAVASADKWNKRVKEIPSNAIEGTGLTREPINVPSRTSAAPKGNVAPPAAGTVKDGYKFKGGNPADPKSWEKI
jgi:hypothetical protein